MKWISSSISPSSSPASAFFAVSFLFLSEPDLWLESSQGLSKCPTAESKLIVNILSCPCELKQAFMFFSLPFSQSLSSSWCALTPYTSAANKSQMFIHGTHVTSADMHLPPRLWFSFYVSTTRPYVHTHRHTYTAWGHRGGLLLAGHLLRMVADEKYSSVSQSGLKEMLFALVLSFLSLSVIYVPAHHCSHFLFYFRFPLLFSP